MEKAQNEYEEYDSSSAIDTPKPIKKQPEMQSNDKVFKEKMEIYKEI